MRVLCYTCSAHVWNLLYDIVIMCMMVCVSRVRVPVPVLSFLWGRVWRPSLFNEMSVTILGRPDCAICKNCAATVHVAFEMGARPFPIH